jgi:GR25 family glycosyltransferase involved in LPS biosynthesis
MNDIVDNIYILTLKKTPSKLKKSTKSIGDLFNYEVMYGIHAEDEKYKEEFDKFHEQFLENPKFEPDCYIKRYPDLKKAGINTRPKARNHYNKFGKHELRTGDPDCEITRKGQLGCLKSHIHMIQDAKEKKYNSILILEDDVKLHINFTKEFEKIQQLIKEEPNWNIIYLGAQQHAWNTVKIDKNKIYYEANQTMGTCAYMINSNFYDTILELCNKLRKPIDVYLADLQANKKNKIFVIFPNIMVADLESSSIQKNRDNNKFYPKFKWQIKNYI